MKRLLFLVFFLLCIGSAMATPLDTWWKYKPDANFFSNNETISVPGTTAYGFLMGMQAYVDPGDGDFAFVALDKIRLDQRNSYVGTCEIYSFYPNLGPIGAFQYIWAANIVSDSEGPYCDMGNGSASPFGNKGSFAAGEEWAVFIGVTNDTVTSTNADIWNSNPDPIMYMASAPYCSQTIGVSFPASIKGSTADMTYCSPDASDHLPIVTGFEFIVVNQTIEIPASSSSNATNTTSTASTTTASAPQAIIILLPLVMGLFLLLASFFLGEEHTVLKIFMFTLAFITPIASFYLGSVVIGFLDPTNTPLQEAIGNTMRWVGILYFILLVYIVLYSVVKMLRYINKEKEDKLRY